MKPNFYSFDIFDTLITRRVATPDGIFALMQNKIFFNENFPRILRQNFYTIRIESEQYIRTQKKLSEKTFEVSFDEIYEAISENYELSSELKEYLKDLEIKTEKDNIIPIKKNIELLKSCAKQGDVVLISDMYFGASYIRELIWNLDPIFHNIKIYSSADYKVSKANTKLYEVVARNESVSFANWTHFGDSLHSDINSAKCLGINAKYLKQEPLLPYEKHILEEDNASLQLTIGNARILRINAEDPRKNKFNFGVSFVAPILYDYVNWILEKSEGKTLYFISRDGYIPKKIADVIINQKQLNIKTKYIYGSRSVWRIATEKNYSEFITHIFNEYVENSSIAFLSSRLLVSERQICDILKISQHQNKLTKRTLKKYCKIFIESERARTLIVNNFKAKHASLISYLKQEIDFRDDNIFFVDIFGSGRTQKYLTDIIKDSLSDATIHFYYLSTIVSSDKIKNVHCYLRSIKYSHCWIELITRSLGGQTMSYKQSGRTIVPELEDIDNKPFLDWGFNSYLDGILSFTKEACLCEKINNFKLGSFSSIKKLYFYVFNKLDRETATIMGTIPYATVGSELSLPEAAKSLSYIKILYSFLFCRKLCDLSLGNLSIISLSRTVGNGKLREFLQKYPTLQKFIFDVKFHRRDKRFIIRFFGIRIDLSHLLK